MRTHRKNHILRPFLCRVGDCRRMFKSAEDLLNHVKFRHEEGFKCEHCDMFFKHKYHKNKHVQRVHLYAKQRCSFGWFRPAGEVAKKKAKGRKMVQCTFEGCSFETRAYQQDRMARHVAAKHPEAPRPEKPHQCIECKKKFKFPYLLHLHQRRCKLVKASSKRVVSMVTNTDLLKLKKMHPGCPNKTFVSIFRGFAKSNPDIIFEGDFAGVLQESINELKKWFSDSDFLNVVDAQGVESTTVLVLVKDLHYVIRQYIDRKSVKDPKVAISQDGGNNKYLVQLSIFDRANLGPDVCGYSSGGRRRSLIIAAANRCKENDHNLNKVLGKLYLVKLEYPTILPCDLSCANKLMGIGSHTSYCPCIYCEGFKVTDDKKSWTTKKALYWSKDARRRTMRMIIELRKRFLIKWRGRTNSARAKADIKNHASVIGLPIDLPEAMLDLLVLLVIPPDPLHCVLLGEFSFVCDFTLQFSI